LYLLESNRQALKDFYKKRHDPLVFLTRSLDHFGRSLQYGSHHLLQSLPRMLTLWFGDEIPRAADPGNHSFDDSDSAMTRFAHDIPARVWMSCLPQLASRLCHPDPRVSSIVETLLTLILRTYPGQAIWGFVGTVQSQSGERRNRAKHIIDSVRVEAGVVLTDSMELCELLQVLAMRKDDARVKSQSLKRVLPELFKWRGKALVPIQSQLSAVDLTTPNMIFLHRFEERVDIFPSLQKPKKVNVMGSDGRLYPLLVKQDTLRKDARFIEFNSVMNKLFHHHPSTRQLSLRIRTYAVVALNEDCGVLEWVQNMETLRRVFEREQDRKVGKGKWRETKKEIDGIWMSKHPPATKFEEACFLSKTVLHRWFVASFANPMAWLTARTLFGRSLAVMSMVGAVVGVGDRHGENILIDALTGEIMHVDFNCLFWRGLEFQFPERVPFRLTPNLVDGLGCTGYLGTYRDACEKTLKVLRQNRDTLLSILETLVHDPLAEWTKTKDRSSQRKNSKSGKHETGAEYARAVIRKITELLNGHVDSVLPLSIEGQVDTFISQATDPGNLGRMFIGWASYM
jgi:serine/threonine-protein kinase ATR